MAWYQNPTLHALVLAIFYMLTDDCDTKAERWAEVAMYVGALFIVALAIYDAWSLIQKFAAMWGVI